MYSKSMYIAISLSSPFCVQVSRISFNLIKTLLFVEAVRIISWPNK